MLNRVLLACLAVGGAQTTLAVPGEVLSQQKISQIEGGFTGAPGTDDWFCWGLGSPGDLDGDGVTDLIVGAARDDDGGTNRGSLWVLFMNSDGTVDSQQKISDTEGSFDGVLGDNERFGNAVAPLSDFDGDGVLDIAVGQYWGDDGGDRHGAIWLLFLNSDGTVKDHQKISDTEGGFDGLFTPDCRFGTSIANLGDLDGDGTIDLAVGAFADDDGGADRGAIWILFLNPDGTVKAHQKISDTQGGFTGQLDDGDQIGFALALLGDLDGDGVQDLVTGAPLDDDGGHDRGALWVLFLNTNGTVKGHQKISRLEGGFTGILDDDDFFGFALTPLGDFDGDGIVDIGVGACQDDEGGSQRGAAWVLFLKVDGTVKSQLKIGHLQGGFRGGLDDGDLFGWSLSRIDDLDGDGLDELAVGALGDDDGGSDRGAVWVLSLDGVAACPTDCGDGDGMTGIVDFLALLAEWGMVSTACDVDGDGVGITDFLTLLANWGPCP